MDRRPHTLALTFSLIALLVAACGPSATLAPTPTNGQAAAEQLQATLPTSVDGVVLETEALSAGQLAGTSGYEELVARLNNDFKTPEDLVGANAIDPTGASDLRILAIRIIGEDAGRLQAVMLEWTNLLDGATVEQTNVGRPVTKVTRSGQPTTYYYVSGDTIYLVSTADEALASAALTALP